MKRPFEVFQDFLKLFLEKGYIETNDDKNVTGYIVNVEDYERIKDYLVLLFFWMFGMPLLISSIYMFMVYINN